MPDMHDATNIKRPTCALCDEPVARLEAMRVGNKVLWTLYCHGQRQMYRLPDDLSADELKEEMELAFVRPSVLYEDRC